MSLRLRGFPSALRTGKPCFCYLLYTCHVAAGFVTISVTGVTFFVTPVTEMSFLLQSVLLSSQYCTHIPLLLREQA